MITNRSNRDDKMTMNGQKKMMNVVKPNDMNPRGLVELLRWKSNDA
jgi:hypothetical protein